MDDMEKFAEKRGVQALLDVARVVTDALIAQEIEPLIAREAGLRAADALRREYGGAPLYIPKGASLVIGARDREIYRKFNGSNIYALSREYDLTDRQIYSVIARVREEDFVRRQMGLFE